MVRGVPYDSTFIEVPQSQQYAGSSYHHFQQHHSGSLLPRPYRTKFQQQQSAILSKPPDFVLKSKDSLSPTGVVKENQNNDKASSTGVSSCQQGKQK